MAEEAMQERCKRRFAMRKICIHLSTQKPQQYSMLQRFVAILTITVCVSQLSYAQNDPLEQYIHRLRRSQATGGSETGFLSVGSTFLYGQGYFEKKEYDLANMYFMQAFQKDSSNAFVNYQVAASLLKQNDPYKAEEAQKYLNNAFRLNPGLKQTFAKEFPGGATGNQPAEENKPPVNERPAAPQGLDKYIDELKYSRATGGAKTQMLSSGLDVLYGYEFYEKGDMEMAAIRFKQAVAKAPNDVYANYLLGVSLSAQGLKQEARPYLQKAYAGDPALKQQAGADITSATKAFEKLEASREIKPAPAAKPVYGGKLVFGNYNCTETIWNGPNANPPYRNEPKGYFQLKSNGTYRWLDNGSTGRYTYNEKTGEIKFLSGYLANMKAKSGQFKNGINASQITVNFSKDYRWECGCDKK
jgi:tetratricopeptide (TPR) repeat protein